MNVRSVFLLMLSVPAVAGAPSGTRQYLDTETVATITVAMEPSVFARERPDLAVNARDYLSLAPLGRSTKRDNGSITGVRTSGPPSTAMMRSPGSQMAIKSSW